MGGADDLARRTDRGGQHRAHAEGFERLDSQARVVVATEERRERAESMARRLGPEVAADWAAVVARPDIDAVDICLPHALQDLPLLLRRLPMPQLPPVAGPIGLTVQASGLALRAWSMRTLGASYTRTLRTDAEQRVVTTGPYRWVRHPGYTGSLLIWTGFAVTSRSMPVIGVVVGLLGRVYQRRVRAEEQLLHRELPGYTAYSQHTKTLVPLIWWPAQQHDRTERRQDATTSHRTIVQRAPRWSFWADQAP